MPNMACSMTIAQVRDRSKTVTRRAENSWKNLKAGDIITLVEKGMGLPKGAKVVPICQVRIVDVRVESIALVDPYECAREGFPLWTPERFVRFWLGGHGFGKNLHPQLVPDVMCRRIEWEYLT